MDITCERCHRTYFVPDDLVQGRTFRAKCVQCGEVFSMAVRRRGGRGAAVADAMPSTSASAIPDLAESLSDEDLSWLDEAAKKADAVEDEIILLTVRRSRRGSALALAAGAIVLIAAAGGFVLWMTGKYQIPGIPPRHRAVAAADPSSTIDDVGGLAFRRRMPEAQVRAAAPSSNAIAPPRKRPRLMLGDRRLLDLLARKDDATPIGVDEEKSAVSGGSALDPNAAERVIAGSRRAFDDCVSRALRLQPSLRLTRRATMVFTVQPDGRVSDASISEEKVNHSELGICLGSAARRMMFPAFQGEPVDIAMPLSLSAAF